VVELPLYILKLGDKHCDVIEELKQRIFLPMTDRSRPAL
jgi:hypothetical protein